MPLARPPTVSGLAVPVAVRETPDALQLAV
jgi:hypothetical protein